jgi:terminase, large subunit
MQATLKPLILREKKTISLPKWLPESYKSLVNINGNRLKVAFSKAERRILRKKKPMKTSEWAEKYRYVTESDIKGPWKNIVTPYLVEIMDAADYPSVQTVILCKCVQSGGSEAIHNCVAKRVDREPGPVMYVYPSEATGKQQLRKRIHPMFKESPYLKRLMTGSVQDENNMGLTLQHTWIKIAWAHSPSSLASDPCRYVVFDEVDKYPMQASKTEADPISLGEKRTTTYRRRGKAKIWKLSTPTTETGHIWRALNTEAQVVFDVFARCPDCGHHQKMVFDMIKWGGGGNADPEEIESKFLAWYECEFCQSKWDDEKRNQAVRAGEWRSRGKFSMTVLAYMKAHSPKKVGFHLPAWVSFFVSLSESAAAFLRGLKDRNKLKDFLNNYAAEPWKSVIVTAGEADIFKCKVELPQHTVPQNAVALTAGIDVQKHGFYYVVRAWGKDYTSWLIDYGFLGNWSDVDHLLFQKRYPVQGCDRVAGIWRAAIDTGGGKYDSQMSSTEETYLWLQSRMGYGAGCRVWGVKGSSHPLATKMRIGNPLNKTPSGKPLKIGMRSILLDSDRLKDVFFYRLERAQEQLPSGAYLHAATDEDYAKQILAEEKRIDEKGFEKWEKKHSSSPNHYLDCECMCLIVADWEWPGGGVNLLPEPDSIQTTKKRKNSDGDSSNPFTGGDYWQ